MVRRFDPRPLPAGTLERILHSATRAPRPGSARASTCWSWRARRRSGASWATTDPRFGKPYSTAEPPVLVLVLADKQYYLDRYAAPDKAGLGMDVEAGWPDLTGTWTRPWRSR